MDDIIEVIPLETFKDYILDCAMQELKKEHFMSSSVFEKPSLPDTIEPRDYHKKELEKAQEKYEQHLANPPQREQLEADYYRKFKDAKEKHDQLVESSFNQLKKYRDMLVKARAWQPPTPEHEEIKKRAISRITNMMIFSSNVHRDSTETGFKFPTKDEWVEYYMSGRRLINKMEHHRKEYEKDVQKAKEATEWIRQLKESLKD